MPTKKKARPSLRELRLGYWGRGRARVPDQAWFAKMTREYDPNHRGISRSHLAGLELGAQNPSDYALGAIASALSVLDPSITIAVVRDAAAETMRRVRSGEPQVKTPADTARPRKKAR